MNQRQIFMSERPDLRKGDTRRLVAAVFGVWALVLQSFLPFAGAMAAQTGGDFWVTLCTSAGIEEIYLGAEGDEGSGRSTSGAGCEICTICACAAAAGCSVRQSALLRPLTLERLLLPTIEPARRLALFDDQNARGPPV